MKASFFFLLIPLGFMLGVAAQQFFLYGFLAFFTWRASRDFSKETLILISKFGMVLCCIYLLSIFSNVLHLFLSHADPYGNPYLSEISWWKQIKGTPFPTSFLVVGGWWTLFPFLFKGKEENKENLFSSDIWLKGVLLGSFIMGIVGILQFTNMIPMKDTTPFPWGRINLYHGNPLHCAASALMWLILLWTLFCRFLFLKVEKYKLALIFISVLFWLGVIFMVQGRTIIFMAFFILGSLFYLLTPFSFAKYFKIALPFLGGILGYVILFYTPMGSRFLIFFKEGDSRSALWKAHFHIFENHFWWGGGESVLNGGLRHLYNGKEGVPLENQGLFAHNIVLDIFSSYGFIIGIFYTFLFAFLVYFVWKMRLKGNLFSKILWEGMFFSLLALFLAAQTDPVFLFSSVMIPFLGCTMMFFLVGCSQKDSLL